LSPCCPPLVSLLIATEVPSLKIPLKTLPNPPSPSTLAGSKLFVASLSSSKAINRVLVGWGIEPPAETALSVLGFSAGKGGTLAVWTKNNKKNIITN
jgi:hypothetical protein